MTYVLSLAEPNVQPKLLRLEGLDPDRRYRDEDSGAVYGGDELMYRGIPLKKPWGDFVAQQFHLTAEA